eukprot:CAMPEP_0179307642 /NCGR_PEP_ID=MMETSP0797-20121207/50745_1 /TAXON_ID=47934 /ORGANISM="Dinophysis acuminata, Strain DAEP01" /LENGTH=42 /DNA_ID= /DNA_START= /DNA_END= /DNA_ORIENTATION=
MTPFVLKVLDADHATFLADARAMKSSSAVHLASMLDWDRAPP